MDVRTISDRLSVGPQLTPSDMAEVARLGFRAVICNRPDGEGPDQPTFEEVAAAAADYGLEARYLPIVAGKVSDDDATAFDAALTGLPGPVLAYCRTGTRSTTLWALSQADRLDLPRILRTAKNADYDMGGVVRRIANGGKTPTDAPDACFEVVIVGGGTAGIAVAASLRKRQPRAQIAIIDPAETHYYQPGWTMVGGGIFDAKDTVRTMGSLIPAGVRWIKAAVAAFEPDADAVIVDGCRVIRYERLIVCPGLKLDWHAIDGLVETLGRNGVTSNYRYDLAPYTWELVRGLDRGRAIFTQPQMPIKCAGAPQKAMYLSADAWRRRGVLSDIDITFATAGPSLFGVKDYVPALMEYVDRYGATLDFHHDLIAVDGPARVATFQVKAPKTAPTTVELEFDMLHVCPPQTAPDFIRVSPLVDENGWVDVDQATLRHRTYENIWALGDVTNTPNAKTAAAARVQAPVVATNVSADMNGRAPTAQYSGYGSCPLTVERGKIVLAEFGYGGTLMPTFPKAIIDGTRPSRAAWLLKEKILPPMYWQGMLKGREWLVQPETIDAE